MQRFHFPLTICLFLTGLFIGAVFGVPWVRAQWATPSAAAPLGNVPAPINVGSIPQTKTGDLTIDGTLIIGGEIVGKSKRISISGADTTHAVEIGDLEVISGGGLVVPDGSLSFQANGGFRWFDNDHNIIMALDGNYTNAPIGLYIKGGRIQTSGDRMRIASSTDATAYVEIGKVGGTYGDAGILGGTDTLRFESLNGIFEWYKIGDTANKLALSKDSGPPITWKLQIPGKLCLKVNSVYDCKASWPSVAAGSGTITETDTLLDVTTNRGVSGYNKTAANVPITIQSTLTVSLHVEATEYRLSGGAHVVTSDDYGHGKTGLQSINADKLDGKHATEIIDEAKTSLQEGRGLQCADVTQSAAGNASAACVTGKILVGGGCQFSGPNVSLLGSYPESSTRSWKCRVSNATVSVTATAVCCSL